MDIRELRELRQLAKEAEAALEEMRLKGADPGDIAECEHHVNLARKHLYIAERMLDRKAKYTEHHAE
jgi:hypothetical protein